VLNDVYIDSGSQRLGQPFPSRAFHNFLNRKVGRFRMFAMQQSNGYPHFVGYLQRGFGRYVCHEIIPHSCYHVMM
jgi:hypothetical protein